MQPTGNIPQPRPGTTFKTGPTPQPAGTMGPAVVHVGGLGNNIVAQTHNASGPQGAGGTPTPPSVGA